MTPYLAVDDPADSVLRDSVLVSKTLESNPIGGAPGPDGLNLLSREFGMIVQFSNTGPAIRADPVGSSFRLSILGIVLRSPKKEMVWVYTRRIVAAMADQQARWYWPKVQLPGKPVSPQLPGQAPVCVPEDSVALFPKSRLPNPAILGFVNMAPETVGDWERSGRLGLHDEPRFRCATPPSATTLRGLSTYKCTPAQGGK